MTPVWLLAQGRQRDGLRRSDPGAPRLPSRPSGGAAHGQALPPPPARLARGQRAAPGARGCPRTPTERVRLEGMRRRRKGARAEGRRPPPPEGGGGEPRADPPLSPHPPTHAQATGAPAHHPPEAGEMIPPPTGRAAAPGREAGAGPTSTPQPPALTGAAVGKRTRASAEGRHTDRARIRQASTNRSGMGATPSMARATPRTPALSPAQGRQRDGLRQGDPPPPWFPRPHSRGERHTGRPPPPTPPPGAGTPQTRRPTQHGAHNPKPGRGETGPAPPPPKANQTGHGTRAGHTERHGPRGTALPAPSTGTARGARATPTRGGERERGMGCSVLGRGAEPLVRTQFLEHPPTLNFGANHLKKWIQHPQKPPIPFLSPHNPHHGGGFWGGGQRVRAQLEQS